MQTRTAIVYRAANIIFNSAQVLFHFRHLLPIGDSVFSSFALKNFQGLIKILLFHKDVIRVVGRNRKNADFICSQRLSNPGKDPYQGKIQRTAHSEPSPAVIADYGIFRNYIRGTDKRVFFIRGRSEYKGLSYVNAGIIRYFADRKAGVQWFEYYIGRSQVFLHVSLPQWC